MPNYKAFLKEASTLPEDRIEKLGTVMINREPHPVDRDLKMTRPAFGGHLMASIFCPRFRPAMATVRPGVMKKRECKKNANLIVPEGGKNLIALEMIVNRIQRHIDGSAE